MQPLIAWPVEEDGDASPAGDAPVGDAPVTDDDENEPLSVRLASIKKRKGPSLNIPYLARLLKQQVHGAAAAAKGDAASPKNDGQRRGVCGMVTQGRDGFVCHLVAAKYKQAGKQLRGVCVHHVGGDDRAATLTERRKRRIIKEHSRGPLNADGKCTCHVKNWKRFL